MRSAPDLFQNLPCAEREEPLGKSSTKNTRLFRSAAESIANHPRAVKRAHQCVEHQYRLPCLIAAGAPYVPIGTWHPPSSS